MKNELGRLLANLAMMECGNKQEAITAVTDALVHLASEQPIMVKLKETTSEVTPLSSRPRATEAPIKKVLVRSGVRCSCDGCGEDVFEVTKDVFDGMRAEDFSSCFSPISTKIKRLEPPFNLQAIDDAVLTNCPLCKKELGLLLWGKRPRVREGAQTGPHEGVKSLGAGDIEGLL